MILNLKQMLKKQEKSKKKIKFKSQSNRQPRGRSSRSPIMICPDIHRPQETTIRIMGETCPLQDATSKMRKKNPTIK